MLSRTVFSFLTSLLCAVAVSAQTPPPPASAPDPPRERSPFEGVFTLGTLSTDNTDYLGRVGEYDVLKQGTVPAIGFQIWGDRGATRFEAFAQHSGDARDQRYGFDVIVNRRLRATVSYDRIPHRLDHDPLTWMDASSNLGGTFVVGHTDTDPGAEYALKRGELKSRLELSLPFSPRGNVTLYASHRQQLRDGAHQALTTNHCSTCHTESFTRAIDQRTRDLVAGARLQYQAVTIDYSVTDRSFRERAATPLNVYNRAVHPATLADVFLNRVSYEERDGALPFDSVPGVDKTTHELRARVSLPNDGTVTGLFTRSTAQNTDTGLGLDFTGASGRFAMPLGKKVVVRAGIRRYAFEGDSVFVDVNEPVTPAGPAAGLTYAQAYPNIGVVDYERAGISRAPTNVELDLIYRPWKKTTIRGGYEWEALDRGDLAEIEKTTTNTIKASIRSTPIKPLQFQARFSADWIDDPFAHEHAAMPLVLQPFMSPGNLPFTGLQYFEFYDARQASLTSYPVRDAFFEESVTWTPDERFSISAHYRYRHADNDELGFSEWSQSAHMPGAQVWVTPGGPVTLSAGYTYQRERTETGFATLAFVG